MEATDQISSAQQPTQTTVPPNVTVLRVPREQLLKSTYLHTLPVEIIEAAERTYTLYLLATKPEAVLPHGKSMVSALAGLQLTHSSPPANSLEDYVQKAIHRAFWDQAASALASPSPAEQLTRIKGLQDDLLNEIKPLFPSHHPVIVSLSFPMSPTSDPLRSYALHLRSVAGALRTQCAPIRDAAVDEILELLSESSISSPELAQKPVNATRKLFELAKLMRSDLTHATIGRMDEVQLTHFVRSQARERERAFITTHWTPDSLSNAWASWRSSGTGPWSNRLLHALGSSVAVSCPFPVESPTHDNQTAQPGPPNVLPPHLFFAIPTLVHIQNKLQAITITACLRVLSGLKAGSPKGQTFSLRILSILFEELNPPRAQVPDGEGHTNTSIAHLADEVLSAISCASSKPLANAMDNAEGQRQAEDQNEVIRAAVDRTLRAEDPTFKLLHGRLLTALSEALVRGAGDDAEKAIAPERLVAGHGHAFSEARQPEVSSNEEVTASGFEDTGLRYAAGAVLGELRRIVQWEEYVWGDVMLDDHGK